MGSLTFRNVKHWVFSQWETLYPDQTQVSPKPKAMPKAGTGSGSPFVPPPPPPAVSDLHGTCVHGSNNCLYRRIGHSMTPYILSSLRTISGGCDASQDPMDLRQEGPILWPAWHGDDRWQNDQDGQAAWLPRASWLYAKTINNSCSLFRHLMSICSEFVGQFTWWQGSYCAYFAHSSISIRATWGVHLLARDHGREELVGGQQKCLGFVLCMQICFKPVDTIVTHRCLHWPHVVWFVANLSCVSN